MNKKEPQRGKNPTIYRWTEKKSEIYFKNAEVIKHIGMKQTDITMH